ncbi:MAG TPA: hypothetical protein EYO97_06150 [Gemmatimonadetes bacterium]|nr:hypothetical protein [Gemmatimonadota bacterium]
MKPTLAVARAFLLFTLGPAVFAPARVLAQDAPVATATRVEEAPTIDGILDDASWMAGSSLGDFVQRDPMEGEPVSERTEVRILYDDEAVYVGAWLFDRDADGIVYGEARRDANPQDADALLLVFDTYLDRQNGFLFATTPAGIEYDGQITREGQGGGRGSGGSGGGGGRRQSSGSGGGFNVNWDGSWQVATTRDGEGWYAEFRIPFSTLRYGSGGAQRWGFNVTRRIRRNNEESFWSPVARQFNVFRLSSAGVLEGFDAPARRTGTFTPYLLGSGRRVYAANSSPEDDNNGDVGFDLKVVSAASLTLDLTYNTDFAQVEVDEQQLNLTRFSLFFPEKRPFFLENAGTFAVGSAQNNEIFFSRRIGIADGQAVPILGGGRITGRIAGLTVGFLDIQTESVDSVAPANNFGVVRVMKELPNRTRIGAAFVSRYNTDDTDDYNYTGALDGRLGIGEALTLDGYVAASSTPGTENDQTSLELSGQWTSRDWDFRAQYRRVGEGFNPEVGFSPRGAHQFRSVYGLRHIRVDGIDWFKELRPHFSYREHLSLDGFSETRHWHLDSHFEFANGAFFQLPGVNFRREGLREPFEISDGIFIPAGTYDNPDWGFRFNTDLSAPLSVEGNIDIGGFYNGTRYGTGTAVNARVSDTFVASLRVNWFDVTLDQGDFQTSLISFKAAYSFTPSIYLQSLLQYSDQSDSFSGNIRFGWLNTAGTGLFLVYNDLRHTGSILETGIPRGPLERSFVIKFTRLLNLAG